MLSQAPSKTQHGQKILSSHGNKITQKENRSAHKGGTYFHEHLNSETPHNLEPLPPGFDPVRRPCVPDKQAYGSHHDPSALRMARQAQQAPSGKKDQQRRGRSSIQDKANNSRSTSAASQTSSTHSKSREHMVDGANRDPSGPPASLHLPTSWNDSSATLVSGNVGPSDKHFKAANFHHASHPQNGHPRCLMVDNDPLLQSMHEKERPFFYILEAQREGNSWEMKHKLTEREFAQVRKAYEDAQEGYMQLEKIEKGAAAMLKRVFGVGSAHKLAAAGVNYYQHQKSLTYSERLREDEVTKSMLVSSFEVKKSKLNIKNLNSQHNDKNEVLRKSEVIDEDLKKALNKLGISRPVKREPHAHH